MSSLALDSMLKPVSVAHVEIWWFIKVVMSSSSFTSCLELNELFKTVKWGVITSLYQLSKTKCSYYLNYELFTIH